MYKLLRPLLFKIDSETIHDKMLTLGGFLHSIHLDSALSLFYKYEHQSLEQKVFGLDFKNPVGLAGGFDKGAKITRFLENLGFGFLEVGTVTQHAQEGNPKPRIFRLPADKALINRMGFNNHGADALAEKISNVNLTTPLGISIGKSKITDLNNAVADYLYSFEKLYKYGDYFAVNISSPNTPGLRQLQDKSFLVDILSSLENYRSKQNLRKPILVKIAPDLEFEAIDEVLEVCLNLKIDGVIATNTTVGRVGLKTQINETGGLSGLPLKEKSTQIIRHIHSQSPVLPVIGVGGIFSAGDAYEKIKAGASLIQIYTGLIYEGPGLVKKINKGLVEFLKRDGLKNISEAVGVEAH